MYITCLITACSNPLFTDSVLSPLPDQPGDESGELTEVGGVPVATTRDERTATTQPPHLGPLQDGESYIHVQ